MQPVCVVHSECQLGEGPLWDADAQRLYWLDIKQRRLHWFEPASGRAEALQLDVQATALGRRAQGGLVMACAGGVGVFDVAARRFELRVRIEDDLPGNRTNDGHVGADGRFWFGTMADNGEGRTGALYRLDPDWRCAQMESSLGIPNAIVIDASGETLYMADSAAHELYAYPLNARTGELGARTLLASTTPPITPDGAAIDAEGYIWSAQWDGWRLVRYAPSGAVDRIVAMPVSRPTSCAFGGPDLRTLYITSARVGLEAEALAGEPLAGGVFALEVETPGLSLPLFAG
ncbi:MAG: SMP-30/gluconolactonase/LRE family protein [Phycisphaerales bacterium]|nr:SMP-30/gluconolactonase/LRE family protein [Hyphomonadaceae bacterium]